MTDPEDVMSLPAPMRAGLTAIGDELAPLEARLEELQDKLRLLGQEEHRLRIELDSADLEPQMSDFRNGAEFGQAHWKWHADAAERGERIVELMGAYAEAMLELGDFIQQQVTPLEESVAALRSRRDNIAANRLNLVAFGKRFVEQFAPLERARSVSDDECLIYGRIDRPGAGNAIGAGPTSMRPNAANFPTGTLFYDTTLRQAVRAEGGRWYDRRNRAV